METKEFTINLDIAIKAKTESEAQEKLTTLLLGKLYWIGEIKEKKIEDECPECGHCENECTCDKNGNA